MCDPAAEWEGQAHCPSHAFQTLQLRHTLDISLHSFHSPRFGSHIECHLPTPACERLFETE